MDGGKNPVRVGDYLLLELISPTRAGSITGNVVAIERQDESGDDQYMLRVVTKTRDGQDVLKANNPAYEDMPAIDEMRTLARLCGVIDPLDLAIGQTFQREEIPVLFGEEFNPGNWNVGNVTLNDKKMHVLLVTLNKQGKAEEPKYLDRRASFSLEEPEHDDASEQAGPGHHRACAAGDRDSSFCSGWEAGGWEGGAVCLPWAGGV